jgi:hypothetical protein
MYSHVNATAFEDAFRAAGRYDQFSWKAKQALFEYLEQYEEDIGEEIELDVIALCCGWSETTYNHLRLDTSYDDEMLDFSDEDILEYLRSRTEVIEVDENTILYMNY